MNLTPDQVTGAQGMIGSFLLMTLGASMLWGMYKAAIVDWAIAGTVAGLLVGGLYFIAQVPMFTPEPIDCGYKAMGVGEYAFAVLPLFVVAAITTVMMFKKYLRGLALGFWIGILARVAVMAVVNMPAGGYGGIC